MIQVKPTPELSKLCKEWIPFLEKKHIRFGDWNNKFLNIGDSCACMVAEAWGWSTTYNAACSQCKHFALDLDEISVYGVGVSITPAQVNKMIKKGNAFAVHYFKTHVIPYDV